MRSTIKHSLLATILSAAAMSGAAAADTIDEAIDRQEQVTAQGQLDQSRATSMALSVNAAAAASEDTPILFSVMAMGEQYVLKFTTHTGSYIVTESNRDIGGKWKLVKHDGLSALIQKGNEKPVRVYLPIPDDIEQVQSMTAQQPSANTAIPPTPNAQ